MQDGLEPGGHLQARMDLSSAQISLASLSTATSKGEGTSLLLRLPHDKQLAPEWQNSEFALNAPVDNDCFCPVHFFYQSLIGEDPGSVTELRTQAADKMRRKEREKMSKSLGDAR